MQLWMQKKCKIRQTRNLSLKMNVHNIKHTTDSQNSNNVGYKYAKNNWIRSVESGEKENERRKRKIGK